MYSNKSHEPFHQTDRTCTEIPCMILTGRSQVYSTGPLVIFNRDLTKVYPSNMALEELNKIEWLCWVGTDCPKAKLRLDFAMCSQVRRSGRFPQESHRIKYSFLTGISQVYPTGPLVIFNRDLTKVYPSGTTLEELNKIECCVGWVQIDQRQSWDSILQSVPKWPIYYSRVCQFTRWFLLKKRP